MIDGSVLLKTVQGRMNYLLVVFLSIICGHLVSTPTH